MDTNKINVAAILKDKPQGTKLYSPLCGDCWLIAADYSGDEFGEFGKDFPIVVSRDKDDKINALRTLSFTAQGTFIEGVGECMLFPSKKMRDWDKLAWKKGDVLVYTEGEEPYYAIFEAFQDDEYTTFKSLYNFNGGNHWLQFNSQSPTNHFAKASDDEAKDFIEKVEKHYGGKLNLETLEIEKQPEFKDGDIICIGGAYNHILIFKRLEGSVVYYYAMRTMDGKIMVDEFIVKCDDDRYATDSEKQQLLDALAKAGKRWNAETKTLEDLPKKHEFKPFDRVLVRICDKSIWEIDFFSRMHEEDDDAPYECLSGLWPQCIPYEGNEHLLGTTDKPKI